MKKIFAVILTFVILCVFTGCTKAEEIKPIAYESSTVDVSNILENKELFETRIVSTKAQQEFRDIILHLIASLETTKVEDFTITFSEEVFTSWEECNNYAEAVKPGKTHLGSVGQYYLWLAQRIINQESKWEEICDENKALTTIAFSVKQYWLGSCTAKCFVDYRSKATEVNVHNRNDNHAFYEHDKWQAFVVESV